MMCSWAMLKKNKKWGWWVHGYLPSEVVLPEEKKKKEKREKKKKRKEVARKGRGST